MRWWRADLHIHSTLSPCASLAMSPPRIVTEARRAQLDLIAICDHNAAENGRYVRRLAAGAPIVLMGMEIQTAEEVEVLAYFADEEAALLLQEELYSYLPDIACDPDLFGDQVVVDEREEIVRRVERLLLSPVALPLAEVVRRVEERGGSPFRPMWSGCRGASSPCWACSQKESGLRRWRSHRGPQSKRRSRRGPRCGGARSCAARMPTSRRRLGGRGRSTSSRHRPSLSSETRSAAGAAGPTQPAKAVRATKTP